MEAYPTPDKVYRVDLDKICCQHTIDDERHDANRKVVNPDGCQRDQAHDNKRIKSAGIR